MQIGSILLDTLFSIFNRCVRLQLLEENKIVLLYAYYVIFVNYFKYQKI